MSMIDLERSKTLRAYGKQIGREGMSLRVIAAVADFDNSYKGAMILAGRLKAIAHMAKSDDYWDEQVEKGYKREIDNVRKPALTFCACMDGPNDPDPKCEYCGGSGRWPYPSQALQPHKQSKR